MTVLVLCLSSLSALPLTPSVLAGHSDLEGNDPPPPTHGSGSGDGISWYFLSNGDPIDYGPAGVPLNDRCSGTILFWVYQVTGTGSTVVSGTNGDPATASCQEQGDFKGGPILGITVTFATEVEGGPNPIPVTTFSTVTCPSTLTMNGNWFRGASQAGNTFVRFVSIQGQTPATDDDLRGNAGASATPLVDDGAAASGDHSATALYNNVVGTSYQFFARAGATGTEQLGFVVFAEPGQCTITPPDLTGTAFDPSEFYARTSQAQCSGDKVEFVANRDPPGLGSLTDLDATIIDGDTNMALLTVDDSEMFLVTPPSPTRVLHFNRTLSSGPWVVVWEEDNSATTDHFFADSFNVPAGDCGPESHDDHLAQGLFLHCSEEICESTGGTNTLFSDTQFEGTSTENVLLLILVFLICWFMWAKSKDWFIKFLVASIAVFLGLVTFKFVNDWNLLVVLGMMFAVGGVYMIIRAGLDLVEGRASEKAGGERMSVTGEDQE